MGMHYIELCKNLAMIIHTVFNGIQDVLDNQNYVEWF